MTRADPTSPPPPMLSSVIARLEQDLAALWATPPRAGEPAKSRVCTMNLVVVTGSTAVSDRYLPIVDEVTQTTPARCIVVTVEPDDKASALDGDVSGVCAITEAGPLICSERVRLRATGSAAARVSSAVDALLVPEIPTALVWLARVHTHDPIFVSLSAHAERVVLDTEYTSLSSLLALGKWARAATGRPRVADLAWTRLSTWQELCARFFDDPAHRAHARAITDLEVSQASDRGARLGSEGALLLGWIATRLGWSIDRLGGALRFRRADGAKVDVKLTALERPSGVAPAALAGVAIGATSGGVTLRGSIRRQLGSGRVGEPAGGLADTHAMVQTLDADVLTWKLEADGTSLEQSVRLGANRGARLLDRTLHRPAWDPALEEAVAFAEDVFEDGLTCS